MNASMIVGRCRVGRLSAAIVGLLALVLPASGCRGPAKTERKPYTGPTLGMSEVVQQINANSRRLPTLWLRHDFEAWIVDDKGKTTYANGDGTLIYGGPRQLRLTGAKPGTTLFELGSNPDRYWMTVPLKDVDTMWWGRYQYLGAPCAEPIPIRPDLIGEVLGVSEVGPDLTALPAPTMRFNPDADAYMFVWHDRAPDRFVAVKEVWYDRETLLPTLVLLFDDDGRVILRAYLSRHERVELDDVPQGDLPRLARRFELYFPDTGSKMNLDIDEARLTYRNIPNAQTFRFPTRLTVNKEVQLDAACGP